MVRTDLLAVLTPDSKLAFPLHIACEFSSANVVQFLIKKDNSSVYCIDKNKDSILHYACRGRNCEVVKYLLESHAQLVSSGTVNAENKLPIHLLCEHGKGDDGDRESAGYIETIWLLLLAKPESLMM
jgi:ankyrin repeat protein